jgi:SOS-response transcriptional repressor LexA
METLIMISTKLRVKELLKERRWTTKVLSEKTGLSESYLTHIKNGTRRWNEDSLKKIAGAFDLMPVDIFSDRTSKSIMENISGTISQNALTDLNVKVIPMVGEIPSAPSEYTNKLTQLTTGYKDQYLPIAQNDDSSMFCLVVEHDLYAPKFKKGDLLIVSPEAWTRSGDIVAVEYRKEGKRVKTVAQITYSENIVILESVNHKNPPISLDRGRDDLLVIGKLISKTQRYL